MDLKKVTFSTDDDGELEKFFYHKKPMKMTPLGQGSVGRVYKLSRGDVELVWKEFEDDNEMESELEAFRTLEKAQAGSCRVLSEGRERMGIVMQIMDGSMRDFCPKNCSTRRRCWVYASPWRNRCSASGARGCFTAT